MGFEANTDGTKITALVRGNPSPETEVLVRMHNVEPNNDLFTLICSQDKNHNKFVTALKLISESSCAALILIEAPARQNTLFHAFREQGRVRTLNVDVGEARQHLSPDSQNSRSIRDYGLGAQVLKKLNIEKICLLTDQEIKPVALEGFDIEICRFQRITK